MNNKPLSSQVRELSQKLTRPLAVAFVLLSGISSLFSQPVVAVGALTAASFLILRVLFDIHDALYKTTPPRHFKNFQQAYDHCEIQVRKLLERGRKVEVKWLGVSLEREYAALEGFKNWLIESCPAGTCHLHIVMISPDWPKLGHVSRSWHRHAGHYFASLKDWKNELKEQFPNGQAQIKFRGYHHTPYWHGFTLNGEHFYLGQCSWTNDELRSGETPYEYVIRGRSEERDAHCNAFLSWFEYFAKPTRQESLALRRTV